MHLIANLCNIVSQSKIPYQFCGPCVLTDLHCELWSCAFIDPGSRRRGANEPELHNDSGLRELIKHSHRRDPADPREVFEAR
jgi:hypothetical protein